MRFLAVALAFMALVIGHASAEPLKLRIQYATTPSQLTPLMPEAPIEIFRHYGKSYVVEPVFIQGSTPALTALGLLPVPQTPS